MKFLITICFLLTPFIAAAQTRAEIKQAEQRLHDLGYWTGAVDGVFDPATTQALVAFQKYERRPITGKLTSEELEALRIASSPKAREIGYEHFEVDVERQVLMLVSAEGACESVADVNWRQQRVSKRRSDQHRLHTTRSLHGLRQKCWLGEGTTRFSLLPELHQRRRGDPWCSQCSNETR